MMRFKKEDVTFLRCIDNRYYFFLNEEKGKAICVLSSNEIDTKNKQFELCISRIMDNTLDVHFRIIDPTTGKGFDTVLLPELDYETADIEALLEEITA